MKAFYYLLILCLLLFASCSTIEETPSDGTDPEVPVQKADSVWTLTVRATKSVGTKALDLVNDGGRLNAYWRNTEKVKVFKAGTLLGSLNVAPADGEKPTGATLSGPITIEGLAAGDVLTMMIPREAWDYRGQNGTLTGSGSIEDTYDYATASVTIATINESDYTVTTTSGATFSNQQSIYRFGFKDTGNSDAYIDPKAFTVSAAGGLMVQSLSWNGSAWAPIYSNLAVTTASAPADHFYYVSLRNERTTDDTYSFVITGSDDALYLATKAIPASVLDTPGQFISAKSISATKSDFAPAGGTTDTAL